MSTPTDLELMMFHDGELTEARHREVAAYLGGEGNVAKAGAAKLAGLGLVGSLVVDSQAIVARAQEKQADTIAASVLTKLDEERAFEGNKAVSRAPKLDAESAPANDNGRFIMVLAGLAAAAAAALFVWGRSAPTEVPSAALDAVEAPAAEAPTAAETVAAIAPAPGTSASAAVPTVDSEESQPSVEVASVDFSAASGTVYYVPSDSAGQTTAVVWLKDE